MSRYELSLQCVGDLATILYNALEHRGADAAARLEDQLVDAFERLARTPGMGHRRSDLTPRPYFFFRVEPYLIVHARETDPLRIVAIVHSARDVRKTLRSRRE